MAEILAPCGSYETLEAALRAGCDAVYLGGQGFSARQNAVNFSDEEIERAVYECHKRGVKLYRTINTVIFDEQLEECMRAVKHCAEVGVDGIITQDLALTEIVRRCCPGLHIHASTQMTIHTPLGVELTKELGFKRTVVSRELPLKILRQLCEQGIEIEAFVHGALCMSVSGQCFMSAVIGSRSANRGLCAQACRLPCSGGGKGKERYDLSLKDLSYCDRLSEIVDAGVASLKIEGRMKRPEYVAMAVDSCKKALAGQPYDKKTLEDVFSRGGFTDGYLDHRLGRDMFGMRTGEDAAAASKALPKIHELYRYDEKRDTVSFRIGIKNGAEISLTAEDTKGCTVTVTGSIPQPAQNKAADKDSVSRQLAKLGDTIYNLGAIEADIDDGLFVSPKELNDLRRRACCELDRARAEKNSRRTEFHKAELTDFEEYKGSTQTIRVCIENEEQLMGINPEDIELCFVPFALAEKALKALPAEKVGIAMPRFTFDENSQTERLKAVKAAGVKHILATNLAHVPMGRELGMVIHAGFGFNLTNSCALGVAKKLGCTDAVASFEMKASQIARLKKPMPVGVFAYGRLPLMLTVNCPIAQSVGCKNCTHHVTDRTGREFPVKCSKREGYVEILNSEQLYLADKLNDMKSADFLLLCFTEEKHGAVRRIIEEYKNGGMNGKPEKLTRGLYYRGII